MIIPMKVVKLQIYKITIVTDKTLIEDTLRKLDQQSNISIMEAKIGLLNQIVDYQ